MSGAGRATVAALVSSALLVSVRGEPARQGFPGTVSIYVESPSSWWPMSSRPPAFVLQVDGVPTEIVRAVGGPHIVSAVVLFDVSGSMSELDQRAQPISPLDLDRAAKRIAGSGHSGDRLRIGTIGLRIAIAKTLLLDPHSAARAVEEIKQRGGPSPLWDAIDRAFAALEGEPGAHAVVINTDGQVSGSDISAEEILTRAFRAGVTISALGLTDDALPKWRRDSRIQIVGRNDRLLRLVDETGGSYLELRDTKQLAVEDFASLLWMLNHLRKSYRLDFVPPTKDNRLHEISVTAGGQPVKTAKFIAYR